MGSQYIERYAKAAAGISVNGFPKRIGVAAEERGRIAPNLQTVVRFPAALPQVEQPTWTSLCPQQPTVLQPGDSAAGRKLARGRPGIGAIGAAASRISICRSPAQHVEGRPHTDTQTNRPASP